MTSEFRTSVTPRNRANFRRLKTNSIQSVRRWEKENELLYAMMEDESEWLGKLFPDVVISPDFFFYALEDGSLLCRLANYIQEKAEIYGQDHNISVPGKKFRYHSMGKCGKEIKLFRSRENVQQFLTWCRSHGIPEAILFESNDVVQVDECREGCRGVIICLMEIVRRTWKFELDELPQLIQLEKEIEDEEAGTSTDLCQNGQEQVTLDVESFDSSEIDKLSVRLTEPEAQSPNSLDSDSGVESVFDQDEGENPAYRLTEFTVEETEETRTHTRRPDPRTLRNDDSKPTPKTKEPKKRKELSSLLESTEPKTELDKQVCKIAKDYNIKLVHRLKEGKYIILGRIMFVRMLNDHMLVRIGGGWDTLEHYLMTHAPKQAPDIVQSPSDEVSASPRNSISSPISGSLSNLVSKAKNTEKSGVTKGSPVILPQGNQQGGTSSAKLRDRVKKKLSLTEKDERDITDAIRKLESSVSQNLATRPASFTSKTFFQLKSRFDKGIFGSSRRISSPDLLAAAKKVESRRLSYTMADVTNQVFDGVGEAKHEAIANNNDTKFEQYESDEANESALGKATKGSEAQNGDLLGEELSQVNVKDSEHVAADETDGSVPIGGLLSTENESEANYTGNVLHEPQNESESCLKTTTEHSPYDPPAHQEVNTEHLLVNPCTSQESNAVDTFVGSSATQPDEEELISLDSAPSQNIEERPENSDAVDFAAEVASEVKEESAENAESDTANEATVGSSLVASEVTQEAKSQEMVECQPEELTPEDKAEDVTEPQGEDTLEIKREEIVETQQERTPEVQSEEIIETQREQTPEVQSEEIMETQREQTPQGQSEEIIETQREQTPEVQSEEIMETQREQTPEVQSEQSMETQREQTPEVQSEEIIETQREQTPEVQSEESMETQREQTPEVQSEEIIATQHKGAPEDQGVETIETQEEETPEITSEEGTQYEETPQVNRGEINELQTNSRTEESHVIEGIKYNESSTKQEETPKEIEEGVESVPGKETVVEVSSDEVTISGEPTTHTQTHEVAKEEQPQVAQVEQTEVKDSKASKEPKVPKVEEKGLKKTGKTDRATKTKPAATETRPKSPPKAPTGKTPATKKSATGTRPSSSAKCSSTATKDVKSAPVKAPTTKTVPLLPLSAKKPASNATPAKSESAKKPERPKTATSHQPATKPSGPARPASTQPKKPPTAAKGPGRDTKDGPSSAKPAPSRTGTVTTKPSRPPSAKPNDTGSEVPKKPAARPQSAKPKTTASTTTARKTVTTTTTVTKNGAASMKMQTSTKTVTEEKNGHQKTTLKKDVNGKTTAKEKTKTSTTRPASVAKKATETKPAVGLAKAKLGGKSTTAGKPSTKPAPKKKGGEAAEQKQDQMAKVKTHSPTKEGPMPATDEVNEHSTTIEEKQVLADVPVELTREEKLVDPMPDLNHGEQETESGEVSSEVVVVSSRTTTETIVRDGEEEVIITTEEATFEQTVGES